MNQILIDKLVDTISLITAKYNYNITAHNASYTNGRWIIPIEVFLRGGFAWPRFYVCDGEISNRSVTQLYILLMERIEEVLLKATQGRYDSAKSDYDAGIEAARNEGWCDGYDLGFVGGTEDFRIRIQELLTDCEYVKANKLLKEPVR